MQRWPSIGSDGDLAEAVAGERGDTSPQTWPGLTDLDLGFEEPGPGDAG